MNYGGLRLGWVFEGSHSLGVGGWELRWLLFEVIAWAWGFVCNWVFQMGYLLVWVGVAWVLGWVVYLEACFGVGLQSGLLWSTSLMIVGFVEVV